MNKNTIKNILQNGKNILKENNINTWSLDAEVLLSNILKFDRSELFSKDDLTINLRDIELFDKYIKRRIKKEPIQYIIKKAEFMCLNFYVDKFVLIPRRETETLVELCIKYINKNNLKNVIDICTGSGCIAISLENYCQCLEKVLAIDISDKSLEVAKYNYKNIKKYKKEKIKFIKSDMFENISLEFKNNIDILISNPPYIETEKICELDKNVKNYEPIIALDGKDDGLYFYKIIAKESKKYLTNKGIIFLEIDCNKYKEVKEIFLNENYKNIYLKKDLAGLDRILIISR